MAHSLAQRCLSLALFAALPVFVLGCPKKPAPAAEDAAPPPPPPPSAPTVTELQPLTDDAGDDGEAEAAPPKKWTGGGAPYNANQTKIKQCCNAIRAEAKQMGNSPESFQLGVFATQCDVFATQVGPSGTAPELQQVRQMLKSIKLPNACQL